MGVIYLFGSPEKVDLPPYAKVVLGLLLTKKEGLTVDELLKTLPNKLSKERVSYILSDALDRYLVIKTTSVHKGVSEHRYRLNKDVCFQSKHKKPSSR